MKYLICSIIRDSEKILPMYFKQIEDIINLLPQDEFSISIFENDSIDNTKNLLKNYNYTSFKNHFISSQNLGYQKFGSVASEERVKLFSICRNRVLDQVPDLFLYDKIIWIESDIFYIPQQVIELITNESFDVYSGISLRCNYEELKNFNFNCQEWLKYIYSKEYHPWIHGCRDGWATRIKPEHLVNPISGDEYLQYFESKDSIIPFYSTYNSFCTYKTKPFVEGIRFGYINSFYNKFDCDTYVVCENLQKAGYNKIFVNNSIKILHIE